MTVQIEKSGIPIAQVTALPPVALMIGAHRIVQGSGVPFPLGNPDLDQEGEKALRRAIVEKALEALQTDLTEQRLFMLDE